MSQPTLELRPILMVGRVRLEPLEERHRDGLGRAADDEAIWAHMPASGAGSGFKPWFDASLDLALSGREAVWAVRLIGPDRLVGATRYLSIEPAHKRLEIGHTWYERAQWGGGVNPACKLALLRYAFETLAFNRVEFKTDNRNIRSQTAIAKLGAVREGVFRAHMVRRDGSLRDSVYFSIVRSEWPSARAKLAARLSALAETAPAQ
jgi:RimJ/RimL family protein N-acetyltransferase